MPQSPAPPRRLRRLLTLLPSDRLGGAESHTLRLLDAAAAAGVAVAVAAEPALAAALSAPARHYFPAPLAWRRGLVEASRAAQARAAAAALTATSPDAVLLPLPWPDYAGGIVEALATTGIPTLVVAHLVPAEPPAGLDDSLRAAAHRMRAAWAAVSTPTAARLASLFALPPPCITVIPNGVDPPAPAPPADLRARLGVPPGAPVILFLGRLDRAKGADLLPAAAEALARRRPGAVLAAAGDGPLRPALEAAAPPGHPLRLLGHAPNPAALMRDANAPPHALPPGRRPPDLPRSRPL